ncbi:MAG TPA: ATP-binding cassette domain-containing protein [Planctomycetes bacterium]|nr:ATP-binding cassette domain-containing protein [Planctomycetota bacterium]
MSGDTLVETRGLSRHFGPIQAVSDLSLTVRNGDVYGFLGLNGAGKTTTLRMILGLLPPTAGTVSLFGKTKARERRRLLARVGAMVESPAFFPSLTGFENLWHLGRLSGPLEKSRVDHVLDLVGLSHAGHRAAEHYSLGMKQRLGIALALVSRPELVILDEPTNGLDPNGILEMRRLVKRLNREEGVTFIISSHLLHEIEMTCSRVCILDGGRLVIEEDLKSIFETLESSFRLDAAPRQLALEVVGSFAEARILPADEGEDAPIAFEFPRDHLPRLTAALVERGVDLFTLTEHRMSLEEFFLSRAGGRTEGQLT